MTQLGSTGSVFLSHNSLDKPAVETLAYALLDAGIEPWLDKWNLVPGLSWQRGITDALQDARAVVVCIGPHGLGHVQSPEIEVALNHAWRDPGRLVIPVLLPGAAKRPDIPDFLQQRTWVDLREGVTDAGVRGIVDAMLGAVKTGDAAGGLLNATLGNLTSWSSRSPPCAPGNTSW
jgi:hypothetical protein